MKYLEFRFTNSLVKHDEKENLFTNIFFYILEFILNKIVPKSNPLQDSLIDKVEYWMIEFEIKSGDPIREIGLDINKNVIVKFPFKNDYGYWLDNNLTINDFIAKFETKEIKQTDFEENWMKIF
ncbi:MULTISPECIES: hypothetical protein [unclassified Flavobacterium]|uniref:hypothetical protein n=1 Tax=unclassified Flavobacterium TaxID=196869 RepID=UPI0012911430|nr:MULTISPECIES: hypothetical protein [unclassified Flavobacterium]MQP51207.1 hypothetical protein [Flavobacterium sp. LMO9]MQP61564.1 hypothetical protein [Flavobacterium sp. LMO6]